jgi:uncharacterized protein (TIGR03435 family)
MACTALVSMLLAVGITAVLIEAPGRRVETASVSTRHAVIARADVLLPIELQDPGTSATPVPFRIEPLIPWIVPVWLTGVLILLVRMSAAWWRVRALHRLALTAVSGRWQAAANGLARRVGLHRAIRIVELPQIDVPLVVGCLRPIVVLPIAAISQLNTAQVEAILAHELAHVRRHDYLVNLMQTIAETLLFYHPAVWWLSARIRDEREHCCDDVAVAVCGDRFAYAVALTEIETMRGREVGLAPAVTGGSLLCRVQRILRTDVSDDSRTSSFALALIAAGAVMAAAFNVMAQDSPPAEPQEKFEVAAVRPNTSGSNQVSMGIQPGGRYTAVNVPLVMLIRSAYRLQDTQLVGAPDWIATERYDITAKGEGEFASPAPGGAPGRQQLMLQSLLEERFKLKVHRETRDFPIYALVVARANGKLGPQMSPSTTDCEARAAKRRGGNPPPPPPPGIKPDVKCGMHMGFGQITGETTMTNFARALVQVVQRTVIDRTGLTGNFNFDVKWTPDTLPRRPPGMLPNERIRINGVEIDPDGPSIFTALQEQLGLKLDSTRGPVEVLVVDHIDRPTPD